MLLLRKIFLVKIAPDLSGIKKKAIKMNISNNKILITGGATGIGLGFAEKFIQ